MVDLSKRDSLRARGAQFRAQAEELYELMKDARAKEMFRRQVIFYVDDLDSMVLADEPAMSMEHGEWMLRMGQLGLDQWRELVRTHGYGVQAVG